MREYTVHEQTIEVCLKPFAPFLWLVCGFEVRVGTNIYLPKPDRVGLNTKTEFDLELDGKRISAEVRSLGHMWFIPKMRYTVVVGGQEVARDVQTLRRWYLSYAAWAVVSITLFLALLGVGVVAHIIRALWISH